PARSSGPGSFAAGAASPHSPPPGSPYPAPASAACTPLLRVGMTRAASRNCAAVASTRNRSGQIFCPVPVPAPVAVYPPAAPADLALPAPRAGQSNTRLCFPSPPTRPAVLSATPPCVSVLRSLPQSWLLPDRFCPALERTPSAARSPNRIPATLRRITGKPSSCLLPLSEVSLSSLAGIVTHLSERARPGWPWVDSGLGESYRSLANVQLPSWNHAGLAACARMKTGS